MNKKNNIDKNDKNRKYWIDRAENQDKKIEKDLKKLEKKLKKVYVKASKEIKKELAYFYANISSISEYEKYQLEATLRAIDKLLNDLYNEEEQMLNNKLIETYIDIYENNIKDLELELEASFNTINEEVVKEIVNTNWSGFTFSETIWEKHLPQMKNDIKQILKAGIIRGDSLQDMAKKLNDRVNKGYSNAIRLVRTETCWIQSQATIDSYKKADVKEYEFMAFLDKKTSQRCRDWDGEKVKIEEAMAGVNLPPLRSTS